MPAADAFTALGFFARRGFLDPETCRRLRDGVRLAPARPAELRDAERGTKGIDRSTRSTNRADVPSDAAQLVEERMAAVLPDVGRHYGLALTGLQRLQFLLYREGDFFAPHSDHAEGENVSKFVQARQVAAVIFLNGEGDPATSEGFRGGALTFYGLFEQAEAETLGFPLEAEEGLLITFPADVIHEVRPVEAGERYTVVTWFVHEG